jgi:hypothetical protein
VVSLPAGDARLLLRWFVGDPDAGVRLETLSILVTSGDPRLPEIVRERAVKRGSAGGGTGQPDYAGGERVISGEW